MNAPSIDIKNIIVASEIEGYTFGTNLFVGSQPDKPNNCITIFDTPGDEAYQDFTYKPSFQVMIRNSSFTNGYALAHSIKELLHNFSNTTVGGTWYLQILATSDILHIGKDKSKRRELFSINFAVERSQ